MPCQKLTDLWIKAIKVERRTDFSDDPREGGERGLLLRVTPEGGKTWYIRYRKGGQRRRYRLGAYPDLSLAAARDEALAIRSRVAKGEDPQAEKKAEEEEVQDAKGHTVAALAEKWLAYLPSHVTRRGRAISPRTVEQYVGCMRRDIISRLGRKAVTDVTEDDVERLHARVTKRGAYAANRTVSVLSIFYSWLDSAKGGRVVPKGFNPARKPPKNPEQERGEHADVRLTAEQESRLVRAIYDLRDGFKKRDRNGREYTHRDPIGATAILALLDSGRRKSEILGLRWDRVDLDTGIANLGGTKGKKAGDTCYLTPRVCEAIRSLPRIVGSHYVFSGTGATHRRKGLQSAWEKVKERAGLESISDELVGFKLHDLRHHRISELLGAGIAPQLVIRQVGHTSFEQLKRYGHVQVADVAAVLKTLQPVEPAPVGEVVQHRD